MSIRSLQDQRAKIIKEMRSLADASGAANLSPEQEARFDTLKTELEGVETRMGRQTLLDEAERRAAGQAITGNADRHLDAELRNFSLVRAIGAAAGLPGIDGGREREISAELRRRTGDTGDGILIPMQVFETRAQTAGNGTAGGFLVGTDHRDDLFIDRLRSSLVTSRLGATVISGLTGPVAIPKRSTSTTAQWVGENQDLDDSDQSFGQLSMAPKHVGILTEISRQLLLQTSNDIEQLTRADMAAQLAEAVDLAAINGNGVGKPLGILQTEGIGSVDLSSVTWAKVLEFIEDLEVADSDGTAFLTHPSVRKTLRSTPKAKDGSGNALDAKMIMEGRNMLADYPLIASTLVPTTLGGGSDSALIFGKWSDMIIGYWDTFSILVNPYGDAYKRGGVQVRAMLTCDTAVRHAKSFSAATL
ncbi:phage major capsid protein [Magnetospirillum sp. 15-1]|uniref:phage major capsid protein n=1 Tax=Magnetospirillum sp. 15-1 TaxID=1979370 RepID=UPI000BBB7D66|nr:phage major capsid protein [Magnetospirillum sp. 15-1]